MTTGSIRLHESKPRRRACIVGIGASEFFGRGKSPLSGHHLGLRAILAACADAGLEPRDIDGLVAFGTESITASAIVDGLRLDRFRFGAQPLDASGGALTHAVELAVAAVESECAEAVVVYKTMKQDVVRYGRPGGYSGLASPAGRAVRHEPTYSGGLTGAFSAPYGSSVPVQHYALHARRHMHEFGTTSEQFGVVSTTIRDHATRNPHALKQEPSSVAEHQASRMIASPLRLLDCCIESDGAGAVVVTTAERAADCRAHAVEVVAGAHGTGPEMTTLHGWDPYPSANLSEVARRAFAESGLGPGDIDSAQIYDHFTSHVIMALEDLGFCDRGAGGGFVASGAIAWPDGSIPVNTSGGCLSEVYLLGMNLLIEAVRQVRGESTSQVPDGRTALVTSGGTSCPTGVLLLGR